MTIIWYMVSEISTATDRFFLVILGPLTAWKIKISKNEKNPWRYIILHKCTKTHDHRLYCSWDMARDRCNCYFLFWAIFWPFTPSPPPPNSPKTEKFKKLKKYLGVSSFYPSTKIHEYMIYCSWDIAHDGCNWCFSFWATFCPFTPQTAWKMKISKNEKNSWRYHHFTQLYQKL